MKRGASLVRGLAAVCLLFSAGCAVIPSKSASAPKAPVAERELLTAAAAAVDTAPWPKPEPVSFFARMTGGGDDSRVTRSDAIAAYVSALAARGPGFAQLKSDAEANIAAAQRLNLAALQAFGAPRLSMNDVVLIEGAIQTLREHRQIYQSAAEELEDSGEWVDETRVDALRDAYNHAIKTLGQTADLLAERIEEDRSATIAGPDEALRRQLSDL